MKRFSPLLLLAATVLTATSAFAADISGASVYFGDNSFTDVPACGAKARVKAVYNADWVRVLRACGVTQCLAGEVLVNTNKDFDWSGDGKTYSYKRLDAWKDLGDCQEIPLPDYSEATNGRVRVLIQSGTGQTQGRITIDGL